MESYKIVKFGIFDDFSHDFEKEIITKVHALNQKELIVSTTEHLYILDKKTVKNRFSLKFSTFTITPDTDYLIGVTIKEGDLNIYQLSDFFRNKRSNNSKSSPECIENFQTNQHGITHIFYSQKSNLIITIGAGIKVFNFKIKTNDDQSDEPTISITKYSHFSPNYIANTLTSPAFDNETDLILLPTENGICTYSLSGAKLHRCSKNPSTIKTIYATYPTKPSKLAKLISVPSSNSMKRELPAFKKKILTYDVNEGMNLWDSKGQLINHFDTIRSTVLSIIFIDSENAICINSCNILFYLNIKTGKTFYYMNLERSPSRLFLIYVKNEPILCACFGARIRALRLVIPWRVWNLNLEKTLSIRRCNKFMNAARILIDAESSFIKLFSPQKGKLLCSAKSNESYYRPVSYFYDRGIFENYVFNAESSIYEPKVIQINDQKVSGFDNRDTLFIILQNGQILGFNPLKSSECEEALGVDFKASFMTFCRFKKQITNSKKQIENNDDFQWGYAVASEKGDLYIFDYFTLNEIDHFSINDDVLLQMFYAFESNCIIMVFPQKTVLFDIEKCKVIDTITVNGNRITAFFSNFLMYGYDSGHMLRVGIENKRFVVFNNENNKINRDKGEIVMSKPHSCQITGFSFAQKIWISAGLDGNVIVWDYNFKIVFKVYLPLPLRSCLIMNGKCDILVATATEVMQIKSLHLMMYLKNEGRIDDEVDEIDNFDLIIDDLYRQTADLNNEEESSDEESDDYCLEYEEETSNRNKLNQNSNDSDELDEYENPALNMQTTPISKLLPDSNSTTSSPSNKQNKTSNDKSKTLNDKPAAGSANKDSKSDSQKVENGKKKNEKPTSGSASKDSQNEKKKENASDKSNAGSNDKNKIKQTDKNSENSADKEKSNKNSSDKSSSESNDKAKGNKADKAKSDSADKDKSNSTDKSKANSSNKTKADSGDKSKTNSTDKAKSNTKDKDSSKGTEKTGSKDKDSSKNTDKASSKTTDKTSSKDKDSSKTADKASAKDKDNSKSTDKASSKDKDSSKSTDKASSKDKDNSKSTDKASSKDKDSSKSTDKASTKEKDNSKSTDKTSSKDKDSSKSTDKTSSKDKDNSKNVDKSKTNTADKSKTDSDSKESTNKKTSTKTKDNRNEDDSKDNAKLEKESSSSSSKTKDNKKGTQSKSDSTKETAKSSSNDDSTDSTTDNSKSNSKSDKINKSNSKSKDDSESENKNKNANSSDSTLTKDDSTNKISNSNSKSDADSKSDSTNKISSSNSKADDNSESKSDKKVSSSNSKELDNESIKNNNSEDNNESSKINKNDETNENNKENIESNENKSDELDQAMNKNEADSNDKSQDETNASTKDSENCKEDQFNENEINQSNKDNKDESNADNKDNENNELNQNNKDDNESNENDQSMNNKENEIDQNNNNMQNEQNTEEDESNKLVQKDNENEIIKDDLENENEDENESNEIGQENDENNQGEIEQEANDSQKDSLDQNEQGGANENEDGQNNNEFNENEQIGINDNEMNNEGEINDDGQINQNEEGENENNEDENQNQNQEEDANENENENLEEEEEGQNQNDENANNEEANPKDGGENEEAGKENENEEANNKVTFELPFTGEYVRVPPPNVVIDKEELFELYESGRREFKPLVEEVEREEAILNNWHNGLNYVQNMTNSIASYDEYQKQKQSVKGFTLPPKPTTKHANSARAIRNDVNSKNNCFITANSKSISMDTTGDSTATSKSRSTPGSPSTTASNRSSLPRIKKLFYPASYVHNYNNNFDTDDAIATPRLFGRFANIGNMVEEVDAEKSKSLSSSVFESTHKEQIQLPPLLYSQPINADVQSNAVSSPVRSPAYNRTAPSPRRRLKQTQ